MSGPRPDAFLFLRWGFVMGLCAGWSNGAKHTGVLMRAPLPFLLLLASCAGAPASLPASEASSTSASSASMKALPPNALNQEALSQKIEALSEQAAPGVLGVAVKHLTTNELWSLHGGRAFPMQSVFKAPLGAAVLAQVDAGALSLTTPFEIRRADLSIFRSPIAARFSGEVMTFTLKELLVAAVGDSDNTAADVLMKRIGGPASVNDFLASHKIQGMRVDRYETEMQTESNGIRAFDLSMITYEGVKAALEKVPAKARKEAFNAYLKDPRDTSTPLAAVDFLEKLVAGSLLSAGSTALLLQIMEETQTGKNRLKAGLPPGARLAHKTGTSLDVQGTNGATNDIGIITLPNGAQVAVAVFLSGATLAEEEREEILAEVARAVVSAAQ